MCQISFCMSDHLKNILHKFHSLLLDPLFFFFCGFDFLMLFFQKVSCNCWGTFKAQRLQHSRDLPTLRKLTLLKKQAILLLFPLLKGLFFYLLKTISQHLANKFLKQNFIQCFYLKNRFVWFANSESILCFQPQCLRVSVHSMKQQK